MNIKRYIISILLLAAVAAGCGKDELSGGESLDKDRIVLNFAASGLASRVASAGVEADIKGLDVFIFPAAGGACEYYKHFSRNDQLLNGTEGTLVLGKRKSEFGNGKAYRLYIVANASEETIKQLAAFGVVADGKTLQDLKNIIQETPNLHLTGMGGSAPTTFLMDGLAHAEGDASQTDVVLNDGNENVNTRLETELRRAAAKIALTMKAKESDKAIVKFLTSGEVVDNVTVSYNYAVVNGRMDTKLLAEAELAVNAKYDNVEGYTSIAGPNGDGAVVLNTYAYSHEWEAGDALAETETYLVVKVPIEYTLLKDESGADIPTQDQVTTLHTGNFYKIPVGKDRRLLRNTCYQITVEIGAPGADDPSRPVEITGTYQVLDWIPVPVGIGETDAPQYLEVTKERLVLHDIADDHSVGFASSSDVAVEVVDAWFTDKNGVNQHATRAGADADSQEAEYNRNSSIAQVFDQITASASGLNGEIQLHSPKPDNNLIRYIKLRITNTQGQSKEVIVEQYPLDYITFVEGYYSYRSDFYDTDPNNVTTYIHKGGAYTIANRNGENWTKAKATRRGNFWNYTGDFTAKVYNKGIKYYYYTTASTPSTAAVSSLSNNRMYHVRITSTSDEYTLGIPRIDAEGYTAADDANRKLVSPSFMLASQLGAIQSFQNLEAAKKHCKEYVETYQKDGKIYKYDDWRLPTEAELLIIKKYQNASPDAMDEVLGGEYYGAAHDYVKINNAGMDNRGYYLRCIRDVYEDGTLEPNQN